MKAKWSRGILLTMVLLGSPAGAHEHREIANKYMLMVGFVNEPAFAGDMNGVDVRVMTVGDQKPVEGVETTLHVTVLKEDEHKSVVLPLKPRYKEPGRYAGYFLPTKSGSYVFVFEGRINGTHIQERFESAAGKFHDVEEPVRIP